MVSAKERARIIATWGQEPLYVAGTVIKCAVCLLFLCGLSLIGAVSEPLTERTAQGAPSHQGGLTQAKGHNTAQQLRTAQPGTGTADYPGEPIVTRPVAFELRARGSAK
jgi:hypothetical protein